MTFSQAVVAYREADSSRCLVILGNSTESQASILKARAHQRLYDPNTAIAILNELDVTSVSTDLQQAEYYIVLASLYTMIADVAATQRALAIAEEIVFSTASIAAQAEFSVVQSIFHLSQGDFVKTERFARDALHANLTLESDSRPYFENIVFSKARARNLLGIVSSSRRSNHEEARFLRQAITELKGQPEYDVWLSANLLMNLSFTVRDIGPPSDIKMIEQELLRAQWPDGLDRAKFEIYASLARSYATIGNVEVAREYFQRSTDLAPSDAWRIEALALFAAFQVEISDIAGARSTVELASALVETTNFNEKTDERFALLDLAFAMVSFDAPQARVLFERYRSFTSTLSPVLMNAIGLRAKAYERRAEASILKAEGKRVEATILYREAFEIWFEAGMEWLAASTAFELYQLTGEIGFRTLLRREGRVRPNSISAKKFAAMDI